MMKQKGETEIKKRFHVSTVSFRHFQMCIKLPSFLYAFHTPPPMGRTQLPVGENLRMGPFSLSVHSRRYWPIICD